ncbi:siroheme synthase [Actibacterium mucosum KCTC 23349]|uniref:Siroheme synthase n=1 Tax=Actibacterium mucosum KCTC 23349 TaxID=1454373 RepID=A0A037ZN42_9RHOB|nr:siroheme synthase CysG [Actibacterium mucosum]KAJ57065.1 siroheme synthase [Actibacterium mucosum KCTC 23349]
MQSFPMFHRLAGRRVVIAGGGEQAAQKARLMLKTEAQLEFLAPHLDDELQAIVTRGRARPISGRVNVESFADTALVFIATGCPGLDAALHTLAKAAGAVVNVVDQPALCDVTTPSIVDRDPVVVAIGTEGTSPVLARRIKTDLEQMLDPQLGGFAALCGRLRDAVAARVPAANRRAFWRWAVDGPAWQAFRKGSEREAASLLKTAISGHEFGADQTGSIALVGAGPGARDLLTLRAVERLQEADVIYYDRLVDPDVLELARRDARRVYVGKTPGLAAWPQERINQLITAEAKQGQRVVRLKSGDPGIFGRATEEMEAARADGIAVEIVPGITAASAASAALGRPLTSRGQTDAVTFASAATRSQDDAPDLASLVRPGSTLAFYMGVSQANRISTELLAAGLPGTTTVTVVADASGHGQKTAELRLDGLADGIAKNGFENPAILFVTCPKSHHRAARVTA